MKEYKIELCKEDFYNYVKYMKTAIVKIEMSKEEISDFYNRYYCGEDLYVVFIYDGKSFKYKIKEPIDSCKWSVAVSLIR